MKKPSIKTPPSMILIDTIRSTGADRKAVSDLYRQLNRRARARVKTLEAYYKRAGREMPEHLKRYSATIKTSIKGKTRSQLIQLLTQNIKFLQLKTSTVSGTKEAEKKQLETLMRHFDFVNPENIQDFGEFMRDVKAHSTYRKEASEFVVELYGAAREAGLDTRKIAADFEFYVKHRNSAGELKRAFRIKERLEERERRNNRKD